MARKRLPENETQTQSQQRRALEVIANSATRNEKVSWDRKMDNMVKLIAKLRPIEEQITDLMAQKIPLFDDISALRAEMVKDCVHPPPHLVYSTNEEMGDYIECKFCCKRFAVPETGDGKL
jgi:hypothetical protein